MKVTRGTLQDIYSILSIGGVKAVVAVLSLFTTIFAAKLLGPTEFGRVSLAWSMSVVTAVVIDFGSAIQVRKSGNSLFAPESGYREIVGRALTGFVVRMMIFAGLVGGALAIDLVPRNSAMIVYVAPMALGFAVEILIGEILRSKRLLKLSEIFNGGFRQLVYAFALLVCWTTGASSAGLLFVLSVLLVGLSATTIWFLSRPLFRTRKGAVWSLTKSTVGGERGRFFLTSLVLIAGQQAPLLLSGLFGDANTAAVVRISLLFGILMQFIAASNAMYFVPRVASTPLSDVGTLSTIMRQSSRLGIAAMVGGFLAVAALPYVVPIIVGSEYKDSIFGGQLVVFAYSLSCIFGAYGQMLLLKGAERISLGAGAVTLLSQIVLTPILVQVFPYSGYCMSYGIGIVLSLVFLAFFGRRATGIAPGPV